MSFDEEHLDDHYFCQREISERDALIRDLKAVLLDIEPYLDSLICYASTINEHFPNGFPGRVRALLTGQPLPAAPSQSDSGQPHPAE